MLRKNPITAFRESHIPPMSQVELAQKLGVTKASVCRWESGERFPERQHWPRIREVTGISPDALAEAEHEIRTEPPLPLRGTAP